MSLAELTAAVDCYGTHQGTISVAFVGNDGDRNQYRWTIRDHTGAILGTDDDLRSGTDDETNHVVMLRVLCDFLTACAESYPVAHAAALFPPAVAEWADANSDAISMIALELHEACA